MHKVLGVGGIFFRARDPKALGVWYRDHLGIEVESWGGAVFRWDAPGSTVWSPFKADTTYFGSEANQFMINFRVADLRGLHAQLRAAGCDVDEKIEETEQGVFGWVTDPEGNRVELWQPADGM
jgi:predicted enzyme related to lactoylglutathione lyase